MNNLKNLYYLFVFFLKKCRLYSFLYYLDALRMNSEYERSKVKNFSLFYSQFLRTGDLCFDVGANVGNRIEVFLSLGCKVIAFEPQYYLANCFLKKKFKANHNVVIEQLGLSDSESEKVLFTPLLNVCSSFNENQWGINESFFKSSECVKTSTLDNMIAKYGIPDFIKIDVEGYELLVLKGLTTPVKLISFEYTTKFTQVIYDCLNVLSKVGTYEFNITQGEANTLFFEKWETFDDFISKIEQLSGDISGDIYCRLI